MQIFRDRRDAGRRLAEHFDAYSGRSDVIVLALPRGGVPVGYEVATRIGAPLDVLVVRKIGVPGHEELAMGAIASGGVVVVDQRVMSMLGLTREAFDAVVESERAELARRERAFRAGLPPLDVSGKTVVLVDDGIATGSSMFAAIDAIRVRDAARIVVAVPVAPPETCDAMGQRADEMICLVTPEHMYSVGGWYEDFAQTTDDEVSDLLEAAARSRGREVSDAHTNTRLAPR
jgi:predicted phosphoribosyltransferase